MTPDSIVRDFDAELSPAERELLARACDFSRRVVAPNARQWDEQRRHPTDELRAACECGLSGIELAPEFGGAGLRFSAKMRIVEEMAKDDFGFAFSLVNHHNAMLRVSRGNPALAARLVDCRGWDMFSVMANRGGVDLIGQQRQEEATKTREAERRSAAAQQLADARDQFLAFLDADNPQAALALYEKMQHVGDGLQIDADELVALIKGFHTAGEAAKDRAVDRDASRPHLKDADEVVSVDLIPKVDDMKNPGADHSADDGPNGHGVDGIHVHPFSTAPTGHQPDGGRDGHKGQETMPGKSEVREIEQVRIYSDQYASQYAH